MYLKKIVAKRRKNKHGVALHSTSFINALM